MPTETGQRAIDKATSLPSITLGLFIAVLIAVTALGRWLNQMEDVRARQRTYIERRDAQHAEMQEELEAMREMLHDIELAMVRMEASR